MTERREQRVHAHQSSVGRETRCFGQYQYVYVENDSERSIQSVLCIVKELTCVFVFLL